MNDDSPRTPPGVLAALALCMLLPALGTSIANVALPTLAGVFGATFPQVQWVVLAYLLSVTALIVGVGRLGDRWGRRRLLLAGVGLFTAASALAGAAPDLGVLVAARALQGVGAAVMMALTLAFVAGAVPKANAGRAMGLLGSVSAVGTALGPTVGGLLITHAGWPAVFLAGVPLGGLALALAWRHLPADPPPVMAPGGTTWATARDPALRSRLLQSLLVSAVVMSTLVVGPFHLSAAFGLNAAGVGLAMSVGPAVAAWAGAPAGRLVDRFGAHRMARVGVAGLSTGAAGLCLAPVAAGLAGYLVPLAVLTAGYALFQAANNTAVMAAAPDTRRGTVSGLLNLSRQLGFIAGTSLLGAVFAATGFRTTFAAATVLAAVALAITARTGSGTATAPAARPSRG